MGRRNPAAYARYVLSPQEESRLRDYPPAYNQPPKKKPGLLARLSAWWGPPKVPTQWGECTDPF